MDLEREELRHNYRLCRAGFALIALGLILLCLDSGCVLAAIPPKTRGLLILRQTTWWDWLVGAPITWCTLVGSYLLLGRSSDPIWQRRAGLLVIMNGIDMIVWTLHHGDALGLHVGDIRHDWFLNQLSGGLGWAEFMVFASIAADMSAQLGQTKSPEVEASARTAEASACTLAGIGMAVWLVNFLGQTDWKRGWPLQGGGPRSLLIELGTLFLIVLTSFQVTALCLTSCRQCGRALAEMDKEDHLLERQFTRSEAYDDPKWSPYQDDDPWR